MENLRQQQILRYWHTLEYLSPYNLDQRIDAADANNQPYFRFDDKPDEMNLPWLDSDEDRLYNYQIFFGVFDARSANNELLRIFGEKEKRDNRNDFLSCFGCFSVDDKGIPIADTFLLCGLPWALGILQKGEAGKIIKDSDWNSLFKSYSSSVAGKLEEVANLLKTSKIRLEPESLKELILSLTELSGWSDRQFEALAYCLVKEIKVNRKKGEQKSAAPKSADSSAEIIEEDETKILNSFYVQDLQTVKNAFARNDCGAAINAFLDPNEPFNTNKFNLDKREILEDFLAPQNIPPGRWASDDGKFQSLMQQTAINLALTKIKENGNLFSVNGPPGTGKTTMLRDIIAALIVERAIQLAKFENPHDGFKEVGKIPLDYGKIPLLYRLAPQITGFEMVVASSNNSAVQNVTQEIPDKNSIGQKHLSEAAYFQKVAENVFAKNKYVEPWGMIAAVLGNSGNRNEFKNRFCFDQPSEESPNQHSLQSFLWEKEEVEGKSVWKNQAKQSDWKQAKESFIELYEEVSRIIRRRQTYFEAVKKGRRLKNDLFEINKSLQIIGEKTTETEYKEKILSEKSKVLVRERNEIQKNIEAIALSKPAKLWLFLEPIYVHSSVKIYNRRMNTAQKELEEVNEKISVCKNKAAINGEKVRRQKQDFQAAKQKKFDFTEQLRKNEQIIADGKNEIGRKAFADDDWWQKSEDELQKRTPWLDEKLNHLRSRLFLRAMNLHEIFVRMSRSKISDNLKLWAEMTGGNSKAFNQAQALCLWQTFFLVVPVVSTTFASLGRMFSNLGREAIGWLLIDEAGQATPQAAVGGIWRAKQTVIVGDPMQIEPVVGLDDAIIEQVRKFYDVAPTWSLKTASAQTLADRANHFGAFISNDNSEIWVGCPLRVHRRCLNPMFEIANKIAYGGKMVYATGIPSDKSFFDDSRWIHTDGKCVKGHWTNELWDEIKILLAEAMQRNPIELSLPKLFIISPFRDVARELKKLVVENKAEWVFHQRFYDRDLRSWAAKSIGTIHTFQGKEQDTVIIALGADEHSKGSAQWAARKPNMLNVAVTRAKYAIYIVGNKKVWADLSNFKIAYQELKD